MSREATTVTSGDGRMEGGKMGKLRYAAASAVITALFGEPGVH